MGLTFAHKLGFYWEGDMVGSAVHMDWSLTISCRFLAYLVHPSLIPAHLHHFLGHSGSR
jgi:hypothetical protein